MTMTPIAMYSKSDIDRMAHLRGAKDILDNSNSLESNKYLLLSENKIIFRDKIDNACFFSYSEIDTLIHDKDKIFLGCRNNKFYFASSISINDSLDKNYSLKKIKELADLGVLKDEDMGIISQAAGLLNWHKNFKFCSNCGSVTKIADHGWRRDCINCKKEYFPRIDPVVIMLVTHGDYCLLGSGKDFPEKRYSCLAGFMEPGETIEAAAARELYEEVGVIGNTAQYIASQPWPFPFSLMIGVHIETNQTKLCINKAELADAMWAKASDIKAALSGSTSVGFSLPAKQAIANTLFQYWLDTFFNRSNKKE